MIYINESSFFDAAGIGVYRKIMAQCRTFEKEFGTTYCTTRHGGIAYLLHQDEVIEKKPTLSKMDFYECAKEWIKEYSESNVYIRYSLGNKWLIDFVKWLYDNKIKSLVEIHTFDNINEFKNPGLKIEDKFYGDMLCQYYDHCAGYDDREVYRGMKVIPLVNGVDLDVNPISKKVSNCSLGSNDTFTMLGVANLGNWQGYERVIEGIRDYYVKNGNRAVLFYIVGGGAEYSYYKKLINDYGIDKNVILTGAVRSQNELDALYDKADICIGALGFYKTPHLKKAGTIKLREYIARGIPVLYGYDDVGFSGNEVYLKQISNDPTPVDIDEVIEFYDGLLTDRRVIAKEMREYVNDHYTWDKIMKPVCDYYKN